MEVFAKVNNLLNTAHEQNLIKIEKYEIMNAIFIIFLCFGLEMLIMQFFLRFDAVIMYCLFLC